MNIIQQDPNLDILKHITYILLFFIIQSFPFIIASSQVAAHIGIKFFSRNTAFSRNFLFFESGLNNKQMRLVFITIILLFLLQKVSRQCTLGIPCPTYCWCCSTTNYCNGCYTYFGLVQTGSSSVRGCSQCSDPQCTSCSISPSVQTCSSCVTYYGVSQSYPSQCFACSKYTAKRCESLNNCGSTSTCTDCRDYYLDSTLNVCLQCNVTLRNCRKCTHTASECSQCDGSYYLNHTNNLQCVRCTLPNCHSCTNGPTCTGCISRFYLNSTTSLCMPCLDPCLTCNFTHCHSCNTAANRYILINSRCQTCINSIPNCIACTQTSPGNSSTNICSQCQSGYYVSNSTCSVCPSPCASCTNATSCQSCTDIQHCVDSSNNCVLCNSIMTNCSHCYSSTICLQCDTGFAMAFQSNLCTPCHQFLFECLECNTTNCHLCKPGLNLVNGFCELNLQCSANCYSCQTGFPSNCTTCRNGDYLISSNKTCMPCPSHCPTCTYDNSSSSVLCLSCQTDLYLNNSQCLPCPNGTYYLNTILNCANCSTYCKTCDIVSCITCESDLFSVSHLTGKCEDVCGDGYVVTLPCDGGKGIANDGCAEDCTIEPNYSCIFTSTTNPFPNSTVSVSLSKCSYLSQPVLAIHKATQSLYENRMSLVFKVTPYLHGLPIGNETQTYLRSIFQLSPLDTLADYSITTNPADGTVTFDIAYSTDISNHALNFTVNFPLLLPDTMFQNVSSQNMTLGMDSIIAPTRLGKYYEESEYSGNKAIFAATSIISGLSYILLVLGLFSRELAGLQHMLLCQTMFLLVLFRSEYNFYLQGLLGFKYSLGVDISKSQIEGMNGSPGYLYNINTSSLMNNFNINFLLILLPALLSLIFMLYRIKNKHLPVKKDFGKSATEVLIGEMLLFFVVFNFNGLVSYSYLYLRSKQQAQIFNLILIISSALFTVFAWSHLIFRPEAVGQFRSAFKSYDAIESATSKLVKRFEQCISWRLNAQSWKEGYRVISINFYFIILAYQIAAPILIINSLNIALAAIQIFIFLLLFIIKPYVKPIQKLRSLFTFSILIVSNLINLLPITNHNITIVIVSMIALHMTLVSYIVIKATYLQIIKKCTERSQVVRKMFKQNKELNQEEQVEDQLNVVNQLISKYHKLGIDEKLQQYQSKHIIIDAKQEQIVKEEVSEKGCLITEERILAEENKHLRYLQGMNFLHKYGYQVDEDFVKEHYQEV